ncbi:hypothetical protein [Schlesneria sp. DSM 10557]|uniref:hypothetical protein n=2 Tax=unclassified Schlesneria TaxID=2762017 RepID=UPI0035A1CF1B
MDWTETFPGEFQVQKVTESESGGGLTLVVLQRPDNRGRLMKNPAPLLISFVCGILACLFVVVGKMLIFPSAVQALPFLSAYREEYHDYGLIPDFYYKLEARMNPREFERFVYLVGFRPEDQKNSTLYLIELPDYSKRAEYSGGELVYEESRE